MYTREHPANHIIVIENDETMLVYLTTLLARSGFVIHEALDAEQGFAVLRTLDFPVIVLMDPKAEASQGYVFMELARNTELAYQPYILVHSDADDTKSMLSAFSAGADDYVLRNVEASYLISKLLVAQRVLGYLSSLYERNQELIWHTRALEETVELTDSILFEESLETGTTRVLFRQEVPIGLPLGRIALEQMLSETELYKLEKLTLVNEPVVFRIRVTEADSLEDLWIEQKTLDQYPGPEDTTLRLSLVRDVSNYHRLIAERDASLALSKQSIKELEEAQEMQARMFAIIGHEMRTPIASIRMLADEISLQDQGGSAAQISALVDHLIDIMSDLKFIGAKERPGSKIETFNLKHLCEQVLAALAPIIKHEGFEVRLDLDAQTDDYFELDRASLYRVLLNLIKNAMLHSGGSNIELQVRATGVHQDNIQFELRVSDDGKGIKADQIDRLFLSFERGDTQRDGSGLGLMISRTLIEAMGGHLEYETSTLGGAAFVIQILLKKVTAERLTKENPLATQALKNAQVLLAEDNPTLRLLTQKLLSVAGAKVTATVDGAEALKASDKQQYDLVVTDLFMPNMNGSELAKALREKGFKRPIVGLSAATLGNETRSLLDAGADRVYEKPINSRLVSEIGQLLAQFDASNDGPIH